MSEGSLPTEDQDDRRAEPSMRVIVQALDETPSTVTGLARLLDAEPTVVEAGLARAGEQGLAMCWGDVWATTWRAKLALEPGFFRFWIPMALAAGSAVAALTLALYGPTAGTGLTLAGLGALAALAVLVAVFAGRGANGQHGQRR